MAHTKSIGNGATTKGQQNEHGCNKEGNLSARPIDMFTDMSIRSRAAK